MYEYIGILLGARPILHISRIKVNSGAQSAATQITLRASKDRKFDVQTNTFDEMWCEAITSDIILVVNRKYYKTLDKT
jgi:hypothetical protein